MPRIGVKNKFFQLGAQHEFVRIFLGVQGVNEG